MSKTRPTSLLAVLLLVFLGLGACSEASPNLSQFFRGRTLHVSVVAIDRMPEVRYSVGGEGGSPTYVRVVPTEETMELVVVRLRVQNHTATSAFLTVDKEGVELRDFLSQKFFPLDVEERAEIVKEPPRSRSRSAKVLELLPDGTFADNRGFINGPVKLDQGTGLDGWVIFEAPKETQFRDLRWSAGDSVTIPF